MQAQFSSEEYQATVLEINAARTQRVQGAIEGALGERPLKRVNEHVRPRDIRIIEMHLEGLTFTEISNATGMQIATISRIVNGPQAQKIIAARYSNLDQAMLMQATNVVRSKLTSEDEAIALRAAEMVYRSHGKYDKEKAVTLSAEDVVARMLEVAGEHGKASVTISATAGEQPAQSPLIEGHVE